MRIGIAAGLAAGAALLVCTPALADTRSDALDRAARCNVMPEGRAWLDCFYGAAQPVRQFLNLSAAPQAAQFQQVYGQPAGASATGRRSEVLERAGHCSILPEGTAWLDCFYGAAQPLRQSLGLSPATQALQFQQVYAQPLSQSAAVAAGTADEGPGFFDIFNSPKVPPERFGLKGARPGPGLNVDRIIDRVTNVQSGKTGFVVTLANGQVWRQENAAPASWPARGEGYTVTITHGAFNSYNLRRQKGRIADAEVYKVQRVR